MPPTGHPGHQPERSEHAEGPQSLDVQARAFAAHGGRVALDDVDLLQNHGEDPEEDKRERRRPCGQLSLCPRGQGPCVPSMLKVPVERLGGGRKVQFISR